MKKLFSRYKRILAILPTVIFLSLFQNCIGKKPDGNFLYTILDNTVAASATTTPAIPPGTGTPATVDIGTTLPVPAASSNGNEPSVGIDTVNNKLLIAVENDDNNNKLTVIRCNLDGSSCTPINVSDNSIPAAGLNSGNSAALVVDNTNQSVYIATEGNNMRLLIFKCNLAISACTLSDITGVNNSGDEPSITLDQINNKVTVAAHDSGTNELNIFNCNLSLGGCTTNKYSPGKGYDPEVAFDTTNNKILAVTRDASNSNKPLLFICNADGSGCSTKDISDGQGINSGMYPVIAVDKAGSKVLVVTRNEAISQRPSLFRCDLDGTNCTHTDLAASAGRGNLSAGTLGGEAWTDLVIDSVNSKLLVVTHDKSNSGKLSLFRCNLDGSSCSWKDISAGAGTDSGFAPSAVIDWLNGKLLIVTEDHSKTIPTPSFFSI